MGVRKLSGYAGAVALGLMLFAGAIVQAQNKTAAPSITVYQDPG